MQDKDWFRIKKYPHIDFPIENKDRYKWLQGYITNPEKITKHSFLPFIHKVSKKRKFRKKYDENGKIILTEDGKKRHADVKVRELFYASHLDSLIFSYYNHLLYTPYEEKLKEFRLEEVVTAYRRIPKDKGNSKGSNKCNIDFANDIFKIIKQYPKEKFAVITFDIKSFFDNINHSLLRTAMMEVLGVEKLSSDFFNVFKNITRFSYVDIQDIFKEYQNEIICKKTNKKDRKIKEVKKKISRLKFLKNQEAIAFCHKNDFLKNKKHLIKSHKFIKDKETGKLSPRNFGIPQGSPISSTLANLYLLNFDKKVNDFITSKDGYYKRYSDDMIIVCSYEDIEHVENLIYEEIRKYKLEIQEHKTQKFIFERGGGKMKCGQLFENNNINWNKNLIYLGFEYDGEKILLKSASLAGFYRKMKKSIRRGIYYSIKHNNKLFKRRLYKKFTFRGARRYKIYKWCNKEKKFRPTSQQNWGNFLSYAKKASNIIEDNKIKGQIRNHWKIFHKELVVYNLLFLSQIYEKFGTKFLYETKNRRTYCRKNQFL